jgi:hypothetical protein
MTPEEIFEKHLLALGSRLRRMKALTRDNSWQSIWPQISDAVEEHRVLADLWAQIPKQPESQMGGGT